MANILHPGEVLTPEPGKFSEMNCSICGDKMNAERNVDGATGWAEAMAKHKHLHDRFTCPNAGEDWHQQLILLNDAIRDTPSDCLAKIMEGEKNQILMERKATKKIG